MPQMTLKITALTLICYHVYGEFISRIKFSREKSNKSGQKQSFSIYRKRTIKLYMYKGPFCQSNRLKFFTTHFIPLLTRSLFGFMRVSFITFLGLTLKGVSNSLDKFSPVILNKVGFQFSLKTLNKLIQ